MILLKRFIRICVSLVMFSVLVGCASIERRELEVLCAKYAEVYVADEIPKVDGYLNKTPRKVSSSIVRSLVAGVEYIDIINSKPHFVILPSTRKSTWRFEDVGLVRLFLQPIGSANCFMPAKLAYLDNLVDNTEKNAAGKYCLAYKTISEEDVEFSYHAYFENIPGSKMVKEVTLFRKGYEGDVLAKVIDIRANLVEFGVQKKCFAKTPDARSIVMKEQQK